MSFLSCGEGNTILNKSIKTKLFFTFSIVFIISLSAITALWYIKSSQTSLQLARNSTFEIIKSANDNFELTLKDVDYLSTVISLNKPNVIDVLAQDSNDGEYNQLLMDRKLDDFIESLYGYKFYISSILVYSENGKRYARGSTLSTDTIKKNSWYDEIIQKKGNKLVIGTHSNVGQGDASEINSYNVISIARAIMEDSKVLGFVMIDFRYDIVKKIFSTNIPYESMLFVIDKDGNFVYHPDMKILNKNIKDTEYRNLVFQQGKKEGNYTQEINGEDFYIVYYKSNYTDWTTVGVISKKNLGRDSVKTMNNAILISILSLIFVVIISLMISGTITRNIFKLRNAMQHVAKGNFDIDVHIHSSDEIEELSNGFKYMTGEIKNLLDNIKKKEKQKRSAELKAYQAQINPHFLYNTLNTVRWLANAQKADNIGNLVTSLIQLLHTSISKGDELISIREEIEYVRDYINIQEYRYCDKFKVHFMIEEEILNSMIPKFTLQPIIENALIHGIEPKDGQGLIVVKGQKEDDRVKITVRDNGVGIAEDKLKSMFEQERNTNGARFSSIGIINVQERIRLFFGEQYGLSVESSPGLFTAVTITFPFITKESELKSV